jgi:hypothetical protein
VNQDPAARLDGELDRLGRLGGRGRAELTAVAAVEVAGGKEHDREDDDQEAGDGRQPAPAVGHLALMAPACRQALLARGVLTEPLHVRDSGGSPGRWGG